MPTFVSNPSSLCNVADFLARCDWRTVGDYLSDENTRCSRDDLENPASGATIKLQAALDDAQGMLESACVVAGRYAPSDLAGLTGSSLAFLKRIVTDLAVGLVIKRRPQVDRELPPGYEEAMEWLAKLRLGERIFGIQENMDAGDTSSRIQDELNRQTLNLSAFQADRYFGFRAERFRPNPVPAATTRFQP